MKKKTVSLIGKPNVGKSTLFNRLVKKNISITEDTPGITRDRIYAECIYDDYKFNLIDTGGIDISNLEFNDVIKVQASIAIDESDVIIFVVDAISGIDTNDREVANMLRRSNKKVIVCVNKMEGKKGRENFYDFYEFGFDNIVSVSAEHNIGISNLLDEIVKDFNKIDDEPEYDDKLKFCLIGRPNVGKSSLLNALLNEDRVVVSDVAGTTRDSIDTLFKYEGREYVLIDTAGMRKKGKIYESVEKFSLIRSMRAIDRSDVCILVLDAESGIKEHDKHIASYALDAGKAIVIVVNKWDTIEDKDKIKKYTEEIRANFQFIPYADIVFLSALTKKRIHMLMPSVLKAYENSIKTIKTSTLNNVIMEAVTMNIPPSYKGKRLKIYFVSQTGTKPPKFTFNVNNKGLIHFSYKRYLENKIRENFDFTGTPIVLQFKNKGED